MVTGSFQRRQRRLQEVSGMLDVPVVQRHWNVSLLGYSPSPFFSSTNLNHRKVWLAKLVNCLSSLKVKHRLRLISSLPMCSTLFLLCTCTHKEYFLLLMLKMQLINYHLINQNVFQNQAKDVLSRLLTKF